MGISLIVSTKASDECKIIYNFDWNEKIYCKSEGNLMFKELLRAFCFYM